MEVLIARQLSILSFRQDDQVPNATYYNQFTTMVEVACQAGVCYYSPDLLDTKCVELSCTKYENLTPTKQKNVRDIIKQEYLAYISRGHLTSGCVYFYSILRTKTINIKIHLINNKMLWTWMYFLYKFLCMSFFYTPMTNSDSDGAKHTSFLTIFMLEKICTSHHPKAITGFFGWYDLITT